MKKLVIRGPLLTASGYGEHARFTARVILDMNEYDVYVVPTNWGATNWLSEDSEERRIFDALIAKTTEYLAKKGQFDISVQVTIPNEWERIAPVNIGVTAGIETDKISASWIEKSEMMDKIITISEHSKRGFTDTFYDAQHPNGQTIKVGVTTPVSVVHYPVKDIEPEPLELELTYDFNYLVVCQWSPRKNFENTVKWFLKTFHDKEVGLIVKTSLSRGCLLDRRVTTQKLKELVKNFPQRKCEIKLLHGNLSEGEMTSLYQHPRVKAYISLSHGEGYGLPAFEAVYNDLPVIAPAWSGHVDFLYMPVTKKGKTKLKPMFAKVDYGLGEIQSEAVWPGVLESHSKWCYPTEASFVKRLKEVKDDHDRFKSQAKKLGAWVREEFSEEKKFTDFKEALNLESVQEETNAFLL